MRAIVSKFLFRDTLPILPLLVFMLFFSSCAQKAAFMQSSVVPAAEGNIKVKQDNNDNYNIKVEVTNLARVEDVYSRNYSYIVWMETEEGRIEKLGRLVSSEGLFSKKLKASLETVSAFEPYKVFITAEREKSVRQPGNRIVLRARSL